MNTERMKVSLRPLFDQWYILFFCKTQPWHVNLGKVELAGSQIYGQVKAQHGKRHAHMHRVQLIPYFKISFLIIQGAARVGTVSRTRSSVSYLQLRADFACQFFLDVRICVLVHSKIKPSRTELSITSALKSAKTRTNLRVSSISRFRGPTCTNSSPKESVHLQLTILAFCLIFRPYFGKYACNCPRKR